MIRIGQRLREEREKKQYSLEQVAKATKIRQSFLDAIEKGEYRLLPSAAYAHGFVKNYVAFLDLPVREYLAMFRREFNAKEHLGVLPESFTNPRQITVNKIRVKQTLFVALGLFSLLLIYIFYQYKAAFFNPSLSVITPKENAVFHSQTVTVSGHADQNVTIMINDQPALLDANDNFTKEIPVFLGPSVITVSATNNFGKISIIKRDIIVK